MIGDLFRIGATLENPRYRLDDPRAVDFLTDGAGARSSSGVVVTRDSALTCSPWYRGIDLLSDSVAKLPLRIFENLPAGNGEPNGGKVVAKNHEWSFALRMKTNANMIPFVFKKLMVAHLRTEGNGYAFIDRDRLELLPLDPSTTVPVLERDTEQGGYSRLWYVWNAGSPSARKLHPDEVLHFKGFGFDGLSGYSVIDRARESLGLGLGAKKFQTVSLKNSARPSIVLTFPTKLDKVARDNIREQWEKMNGGLDNQHRTAVLDNGMGLEKISFNAEEIQLLQTQEFSIRDIANFLGVPAHKLGDVGRQGYASLEQENLSFLGDTLEAILVCMEEELTDKLLTEKEKAAESHAIQFNRKKLTLSDITTRANYWRTALGGHPWATPEEAREDLDFNFREETDFIPTPANMVQGGGPGGVQNQPVDPTGNFPKGAATGAGGHGDTPRVSHDTTSAELRDATAAALAAGVARVVKRIGKQARAKATKPAAFVEWVDGLRRDNAEAIAGELRELERAAGLAHVADIVGKTSPAILGTIVEAFQAVASHATAKTLPDEVEAACGRLEAERFLTIG